MSTPNVSPRAAKGGGFAAWDQPDRLAAAIRCDVLNRVSTVKHSVRATSARKRDEMSAMLLTDLALATDPGLPEFFLGQLQSLVARQAVAMPPAERIALCVAAFSVFLDCLDLGLGEEAHTIVGPLMPPAVRAL